MRNPILFALMVSLVLVSGCGSKDTDKSKSKDSKAANEKKDGGKDSKKEETKSTSTNANTNASSTDKEETEKNETEGGKPENGLVIPVPIENGIAKLSQENSLIEFTGTHNADEPNPRLGTFQDFTGEAKVDMESKTLTSITLEFKTDSLLTEFPKLTTHLKSADFFDTQQFPTAKFESTQFDKEKSVIKGNLTLLGKTKELEIPAVVSIDDKGLIIYTNYFIDRSDFGMDKLLQQVKDGVAISVYVGTKSLLKPSNGP